MIQARPDWGLIRCGRHGCGVDLGFYEYVDQSGPRDSERLLLDGKLVQHTDAEGAIWEEPESRRRRRLRGLPSVHHRNAAGIGIRFRNQKKPKPVSYLKVVEPPARIRCTNCRTVNFWPESVVA